MKRKLLSVTEIPEPSGCNHPEAPFDCLPKHEFSMGLIAPKGSGKTTLLINLLNFYKKYFHAIVIFSPTVKNDPKWGHVKEGEYLSENLRLKQFMKKMAQKREKEHGKIVGDAPMQLVDDREISLPIVDKPAKGESFDGKIPAECFFHEFDPESLDELIGEQQRMIDKLQENKAPKHVAHRMLWIFDDMVGSGLFSNARRNTFKMLNTNHRHLSSSILEVSQAYKEIPKTVRCNFTCLILFEIYNDKELECIYEEYPMGLTKKEWYEAFKYCTSDPFSFMYYNIMRPKELRIMKNFDEYIMTNKDLY
jgi:hypothetical protein